MLWYSALIQCACLGTKAELRIGYMKTNILAGLVVAAALAIAPGVALARGGGGGRLHGGGGSHGGGGGSHGGAALTRSGGSHGGGEAFTQGAAFTAVALTAALRTVLSRTDRPILGMGFVMIMTASSVIILCSVTPGLGITTLTISGPTTIIPRRCSGR